MKYYAVVHLKITDPSWIGGYVEKVTDMVNLSGGRYLARTNEVELIEGHGQSPDISIIIEFPSKVAAERFYYSDEYLPFREQRLKGSHSTLMLIAGKDMTTLEM